jgi:hypothetical protein
MPSRNEHGQEQRSTNHRKGQRVQSKEKIVQLTERNLSKENHN